MCCSVLYSYCACVNCGKQGKWRVYSPFACTCTECGHPLAQCDFPYDPTEKDAGQKNKEFLEKWIKRF